MLTIYHHSFTAAQVSKYELSTISEKICLFSTYHRGYTCIKHLFFLGQWLNLKLFGITYLVGKIKFKLFFRVHWLSENFCASIKHQLITAPMFSSWYVNL